MNVNVDGVRANNSDIQLDHHDGARVRGSIGRSERQLSLERRVSFFFNSFRRV
jgi:hypothetical protein